MNAFSKKDLFDQYDFAANQIARFFINRYYKGVEWYWYRDITSGEIHIKDLSLEYTVEDMLNYLKYNATRRQIQDYQLYYQNEPSPFNFNYWKKHLNK